MAGNLVRKADGLLGTHVTLTSVENGLRDALGTTARFGPRSEDVVEIGKHNGMYSRLARMNCDWEGAETDKDGMPLPESVVVKMATCLTMAESARLDSNNDKMWTGMEEHMKEMHNTECSVYNALDPIAEQLRVPRVYYSKPFNNETLDGHIVMEFIDDAEPLPTHRNPTLGELRAIARELGKMQGLVYRAKVALNSLAPISMDIYTLVWSHFKTEPFLAHLTAIAQEKPELTEVVDRVKLLAPLYIGSNLQSTLHDQMGIPPVLVHGDIHTANILMHCDSDKLRALIDWQQSHFGSACEDIVRMALCQLSKEDRHDQMDELLETMHGAMAEQLEDGDVVPYSIEQLRETSAIAFPHIAFFVLPWMLSHLEDPGSADARTSRLNKIIGVLEDIVLYHDRNELLGHSFR